MGQLVFIPNSSAAGAISSPSDAIHLYLSGRNGDDDNDGLTPATARATPAGIWALFPSELSGPLVVHVGAAGVVGDDVGYTWSTMPAPMQLNETARIWIYGDGAGQAGEDGFEVITTGVADTGTDVNQITIATPVVTNVYQSYTLEMTSGPALGYRRTIMSNTTTSIVPTNQFSSQAGVTTGFVPVSGNTFRIIRPSVIFDGIEGLPGQAGFLANLGAVAPFFLVNLAFSAGATNIAIENSTLYMAGVEWRGTGLPAFSKCSGSIGWWDNLSSGNILPRSTIVDTAKSQWFEDIGMTANLQRLAEWRGWGFSTPEIIAVVTSSTINSVYFSGCLMSVSGTWGAVFILGSDITFSGHVWGTFRVTFSHVVLIGRGSGVANSCWFRYWMPIAASRVFSQVPFAFDGDNGGVSLTNNTYFQTQSGTVVTVTVSTSQNAFYLAQSSVLNINGALTAISPASSGVFAVDHGSRVTPSSSGAWTLIVTHSSGGSAIVLKNGSSFEQVVTASTITITGNILVNAAFCRFTSLVTLTGLVQVSNGGLLVLDAGITASGTASTPMQISGGGEVIVTAGTTSLTSTGTTALTVVDGKASFAALTLVGVGGTAMTLTNSDVKCTGTVTTTGGATLTQGTSVLFTGAVTIGGALAVTVGCAIRTTAALTCSSTVTLTDSSLNVGGAFSATGLVTANSAEIITQAAFVLAGGYLAYYSDWIVKGTIGVSSITAPPGGACLTLQAGSCWSMYQISGGALSLIGVAGQPCVSCINDSEVWLTALATMTLGDYGVRFNNGGRVYCLGSASMVSGTVADFTDNQGDFENTIFSGVQCIFTGQHPAGAYSAAGDIVGSGFVQKV